ncbi:MAG: hypothetical protein J5701_02880 [Bacteroidales bacterium]|nr:hypothetical protein [Bacteroidales bacterium]
MQIKNNGSLYERLRNKYPVFVFESYTYKIINGDIHIQFKYTAGDDIVMEPCTVIKNNAEYAHFLSARGLQQLDTLFFQLGMVELISYWKAVCSPIVKIKPGSLDEKAVRFWKKLYFNGLGEFFYVNGINASEDGFMQIEAPCDKQKPLQDIVFSSKTIVPVGGGKDSVVTLEALRTQEDIKPLIINPRGATLECAQKAGFENNFFEISRTISPALLDLNARGFLNGHTPFSAMLAFYSLLAACLSGRKNIALSNESSADESTVRGMNVNHQYSKSLEFESDFRNYVAEYIHKELNYYSFLRPVTELQIASLFAQCEPYHTSFKSCNAGSKQNVWCCNCAKCLFTYIILSPFISSDGLEKIYGENLLNKESLLDYLQELCGMKPTKPFECVGTVDEVNLSLAYTAGLYEGRELPALLKYYVQTPQYARYRRMSLQSALQQWNKAHFLNKDAEKLLKTWLKIK